MSDDMPDLCESCQWVLPNHSPACSERPRRRRRRISMAGSNPPYGMTKAAWSVHLWMQGWASLADGLVLLLSFGQVTSSFALHGAFKNAKKALKRNKESAVTEAGEG